MTTGPDALVAFVTARVDELEADARKDTQHEDLPWTPFATADPDRVLRQVAAYRALLADLAHLRALYGDHPTEVGEGRRFQAALAIGHLATQWDTHPDYREDYRP